MEEEVKAPEEIRVKVRPVMEVPVEELPQVIGRFRVQCGPLEDGKAVCRLTKETEGN